MTSAPASERAPAKPVGSRKERVFDAQFCFAANVRSGAHDYGSALSVTFERPIGKNNRIETEEKNRYIL
jgi:hypothetical protein